VLDVSNYYCIKRKRVPFILYVKSTTA